MPPNFGPLVTRDTSVFVVKALGDPETCISAHVLCLAATCSQVQSCLAPGVWRVCGALRCNGLATQSHLGGGQSTTATPVGQPLFGPGCGV